MSDPIEVDYWKSNGLVKPQSIVVCAAIRVGGVIFCGARHCDSVMHTQADAANMSLQLGEQGFINQFGEFLSREEAMKVVKEARQPFNIERNRGDTVLFSEGLY